MAEETTQIWTDSGLDWRRSFLKAQQRGRQPTQRTPSSCATLSAHVLGLDCPSRGRCATGKRQGRQSWYRSSRCRPLSMSCDRSPSHTDERGGGATLLGQRWLKHRWPETGDFSQQAGCCATDSLPRWGDVGVQHHRRGEAGVHVARSRSGLCFSILWIVTASSS